MTRAMKLGLVCAALALGCGAATTSGDEPESSEARCTYERVVRDARGEPRNAAGQVRFCWPGEARCYCDRDNDCYAQAGYTPRCSPWRADAGVVLDAGVRRDAGAAADRGAVTDRGVLPTVDVRTSPTPSPAPATDAVVYAGALPTRLGRSRATLRVGGEDREVYVYLPRARAARPAVLLLLHGTNGSGTSMLDETDAERVAEREGLVLVAPSSRWMGRGDWDHRTEETYWETADTDPARNPDLLLARALIAESIRRYDADPARVYALGHSNGAFFSLLAAAALPDRVAAFASSSGGLVRCGNTWGCGFQGAGSTCATLRTRAGWCGCGSADRPIAVRADGRMPPGYLAHGTRDPLVSVQYTCELEARMRAVGAPVQTALRDGDGHVVPGDFVSAAWAFLRDHRRR